MSLPLLLHVVGGFGALVAMIVAVAVRKGSDLHRTAGKVYVAAMAASLAMALVVSVQTSNLFLTMIAVFSAYFVYTGWRLGAHRSADVTFADRMVVGALMMVGIAMLAYGAWMLVHREDLGVVMVVFGVASVVFAGFDLTKRGGWPTGKERIRLHVTRMGAASIATLTAPTVVNIRTEPEFISWLLPSILVTPLIARWASRVGQGKMSFRDRA